MTSIQIKGLEQLQGKLDKLEQLEPVKDALKAAALHVKGKIAIYPPASEANSPGQKRWYERGYGPRWTLAGGGVGGRKTSETLGRKWTIGSRDSGLTQVVGNNVSYGPFVQGEEQAAFHKRRGWKTVDDVAQSEEAAVVQLIQREVDKILNS